MSTLNIHSISSVFFKLLFFLFKALNYFVSRFKEEISLIDCFYFILLFISIVPELNRVLFLSLEPLNSSVCIFKAEVTVPSPQIVDLTLPEWKLLLALIFIIHKAIAGYNWRWDRKVLSNSVAWSLSNSCEIIASNFLHFIAFENEESFLFWRSLDRILIARWWRHRTERFLALVVLPVNPNGRVVIEAVHITSMFSIQFFVNSSILSLIGMQVFYQNVSFTCQW